MIRLYLFLAAISLCAWYAYKAGSKPERAAISAQILALLLTSFTAFVFRSDKFAFFWGWVVTDALLMVALLAIALKANRLWTMVLAGLHLASIFVHLSKLVYPSLPPFAYALLLQVWAWPMLITTAIGTWNHQKRRQSGAAQPDWKPTGPLPVLGRST